jgi:molecular chaperone IbpA
MTKTLTAYLPDYFNRSFVGFEDMMNQLRSLTEATTKSIPTYPPYNIKQIKDNKYVIEMAVAGFSKTDIELTMEGNKLFIKGSVKDETDESYLYKGIANRNFHHSFTLADTLEIKDVELINGMLKVWLENIVKTQDAIKKIAIKG